MTKLWKLLLAVELPFLTQISDKLVKMTALEQCPAAVIKKSNIKVKILKLIFFMISVKCESHVFQFKHP